MLMIPYLDKSVLDLPIRDGNCAVHPRSVWVDVVLDLPIRDGNTAARPIAP